MAVKQLLVWRSVLQTIVTTKHVTENLEKRTFHTLYIHNIFVYLYNKIIDGIKTTQLLIMQQERTRVTKLLN